MSILSEGPLKNTTKARRRPASIAGNEANFALSVGGGDSSTLLHKKLQSIMTFSELIRSEKPVLVDFSAEWCGPCRMLAPILEDVKQRVGDRALIYKLDIDRNPLVASSYQVMAVPTLIIFRDGKPVWRRSGVLSAAEIVRALEPFMEPAQA